MSKRKMKQAGRKLCPANLGGSKQDQYLEQDAILIGQKMESDIWLEVAGKMLKRRDDLTSLNNSSPFFRNLFGLHQDTSRSLFLFKKAFKIMVENIWKNDGPAEFSLSEILNCRQVCKQWNQVVDNLLTNEWETKYNYIGNNIFTKGDPQRSPKVYNLLSHFESTHPHQSKRNPFITQNITVFPGLFDNQDFFEGVGLMMSKYGNHVEVFDAIVYANENYCTTFSNWLVQMPELKHIEIRGYCYPLGDPFDFENVLIVSPFPKLERLKSLTVERFPNVLLCGLINKNNHISELRLCKSYKNENIDFSLFPPLPNLRKLKITTPENVSSMLCSQMQCINLQDLELTITLGLEGVRWSNIFRVIQDNFALSLENLRVHEKDKVSDEKRKQAWQDSLNCRLYMPKLRDVELNLKNPISLNFLLPMTDTLGMLYISSEFSVEDYVPLCSSKTMRAIQAVQNKHVYGEELTELLNEWT